MARRVALYTRVSTDKQTTDNQLRELRAWAERAGHEVVAVFEDKAVSGSKGRDKRPQFDAMLKAAVRREFDVVAVWSTDRLARSLEHLIEVLKTVKAVDVDLFIHSQALDTSTPAGRMLFQVLGVISEFEKELIVSRVNAGLDRARAEGKVLGRPALPDARRTAARDALVGGASVRVAARAAGVSVGAAAAMRKELVAAGELTT